MHDALRRVAREAREAAEVDQSKIATAAGVSVATISRFETGRRKGLRQLDRITAAYESECGLKSGELWRRAILG